MKRFKWLDLLYIFIALVVIVAFVLPAEAEAEDIITNWSYQIVDEYNVTITGYSGSGGSVEIPSSIEGVPVTAIENYALAYRSDIQSVIIPNSVTSIGEAAFMCCSGITELEIPSSVTSIGQSAFSYCTGLEKVDVNATVTELVYGVFANCSSLQEVTLPSTITSLGEASFRGCTSLTAAPISEDIISIGDFAFSECSGLQNAVIPEGVTYIGDSAFSYCSGMTTVDIPSSVTTDISGAFYCCTAAYRVNTANPKYSNDAFGVLFNKDKTELVDAPNGLSGSYSIPNGVESVCDRAFLYCTELLSVIIPDSVTYIGEAAFHNCQYLTSITIGQGVTDIGNDAFWNCERLEEVNFNATAMNDLSDCNWVFAYAGNVGNGITVNIGSNVTRIPAYLFHPHNYEEYAPNIRTVNFVAGSVCQIIGDYAFNSSKMIQVIYIPVSLTSIGDSAFYYNMHVFYGGTEEQWHSISGYNNAYANVVHDQADGIAVSIHDYCATSHAYCEFCDAYISETATGDHSFENGVCNNCGVSEDWGYRIDSPNDVTITGYNGAGGNVVIPTQIEGIPVTGIGGYAFEDQLNIVSIVIPDCVISIESRAFYELSSLKSVSLGSGVKSIGSSAFSYCTGLTSIDIPDSVTKISTAAFSYCTGLRSIPTLGSITSINSKIFEGCINLESVVIPDGVTGISIRAFADCANLQYISIPSTVTWCAGDAFEGCSSLVFNEYDGVKYLGNSENKYVLLYGAINREIAECTIPAGVRIIVDSAFVGCYNLKEIVIPEGVINIGYQAFFDCNALRSVVLPESLESVDSHAFNSYKIQEVFYWGSKSQANKIYIGGFNDGLNIHWHYSIEKIQFCGKECYYCEDCEKSLTLDGEHVKATVTFQNWDGTTLYTDSYYWNESPLIGLYPQKPADDANNYIFAGWDKTVVHCQGDVTYTATFVEVPIHYIITFKNWDGTVLSELAYLWGNTVSAPTTPTRPADNQYTYTFSGWDSDIVSCAGNATYTATYTATDIDYTVAFMNWNGSVIDYGVYHYGDVLNFPVVPNRPSDNKYTYTFAGWDSADTSCSGNAVYTAVFKQTEINYTVVFKDWNGNVLSTKIYHYGDKVSAPTAPTRAADHMYTYTFDGWDKAVVDCSGNATYTALYKSTYRSYTVTFKNWDGTILSTKTYNYGDTILAPSVPKRPNSSKYSYTYVGWDGVVGKCTGNATYTAVFTAQSLVPTTVTSTKHTVSGGTISKIGVGTTVSTLIGNLNENSYAKVYQGNNVVSGSTLIGTGMEVKIMDGSTVKATATVVVTGDTNGDGKLTITDMLAAKSHLLKKNNLEGASSQAADTNGDGGISITDFIQMKAHILGKSTVEPKSAVTTVSVGVARSGAVACAAKVQPAPQAEAETVSVPAPVDVILPDKKLFALV